MAVYNEKFPAVHLAGEELEEFKDTLTRNTTGLSLTVKVEEGRFSYDLDSLTEFADDLDLPKCVKSFEISLRCDEGRINIDCGGLGSSRVRISGERDWVRSKQNDIERFLGKHKSIARTYSTPVIISLFIVQVLGTIFYNAATPDPSPLELTLKNWVLFISAAILAWGWPVLLVGGLNLVYPKHLLKRSESDRYRPRVQKTAKVAVFAVTLLGGIGSIIALLTS